MKRLAILLAGAIVLPAAAVTASRSFESLDQDPLTTFRSNTDAVSVMEEMPSPSSGAWS